ncbi:MAG TPA: head GIN domain-containing protein [Puia sp.]|nr:head GIN domain-containing protein [Puia sp.]
MKNTLLLSLFTLATLFSFAQDGKVINDRNAQKRNVQGFHGIRISSGIDLYLSQSSEEAVAVSAAEPQYRDRIVTEVDNGILHIYMENHGYHWWDRMRKHLKAYVSCKALDQLTASGGSDVYVQDAIHGDRLKMDLSGGSDLHGKFTVGDLTITQSGGSDSYISGSAGSLSIHTSGGSDYHGYDLAADHCQVDASGGSDAYLTVNKELTAHASGGSDIHYKGNGIIRDSHTSGSGSISHRD